MSGTFFFFCNSHLHQGNKLVVALVQAHFLVNILCMNLEFTPLEKQALLEAPSLDERHDQLITLMKMAVAEEKNSSTHFIN